MARPVSISTEKLVEAAPEVFLEHGCGASTSQIARSAGVSEGVIFKRFTSKEALFFAAMEVPQPDWDSLFDPTVPEGGMRERLVELGLRIVAFQRELLPRMTILRSHTTECLRADDEEPPPVRFLRRFSAFLQEQAAQGRLATEDPELVARMIMGSLFNFVFFEFMGLDTGRTRSAESYVRGLVDTLWRGVGP